MRRKAEQRQRVCEQNKRRGLFRSEGTDDDSSNEGDSSDSEYSELRVKNNKRRGTHVEKPKKQKAKSKNVSKKVQNKKNQRMPTNKLSPNQEILSKLNIIATSLAHLAQTQLPQNSQTLQQNQAYQHLSTRPIQIP